VKGVILASAILISFLKEVEGLSLKPYLDGGDKGFLTHGYGHLIKPNEDVRTITIDEAEQLLESDARDALDAVDRLVKMPLNPWQEAAVAAFIFNLGERKVKDSNTLKLLNEGEYQAFADALLKWDKTTVDGKKVSVPGLLNRRKKERSLFLHGEWKNALKEA